MTEPNSVKAVLEQLAEAEKQRAEPNLSSKQRRARTVSRLAAVQALYQMELAGEGVETVITEFSNFRFDADIEGEALAEADEAYFGDIVRGVIESQRDIDTAIKARLASNWRLERIDATLRALLRSRRGPTAHRGRGRQREQGLVACEGIVVIDAACEQPLDAPGGPGEDPRDLVRAGRG